jgi:Tol biopolymer transport system component
LFKSFLINGPPQEAKDVYIYDIANKRTQKITQNRSGQTSYYPVWKKDNSIVYLHRNSSNEYSFVTTNSLVNKSEKSASCIQNFDESKKEAYVTLGRAWTDICLQAEKLTDNSYMLSALSLDYKRCNELVNKYWKRIRAATRKISSLNKSDYLALCSL